MRRQEAQSTRKTSLGSLDPIEKAVVAKFTKQIGNIEEVLSMHDAPDAPVWAANCSYGTEIILAWNRAKRAVMYEIRSEDADWGEEGYVWQGTSTMITLPARTRSETFYIKSINAAGIYSEQASSITLENEAPSAPVFTLVSSPSGFTVLLSDTESDVVKVVLSITEVDEQQKPLGETVQRVCEEKTYFFAAEPRTNWKVSAVAYDIIGAGEESAAKYVTVSGIDAWHIIDIPEHIVSPSHLTESLREQIDTTSINVDGALTQIKQLGERLEDAEDDLSDAQSRLDTVDDTLQTHAEMIAERVTQAVFEGLESRVDSELSYLADEIQARVTQTVFETLAQRVTDNEATLTVHADMIAARVTQEVFDQLEGRVSTAEGELTVLADEVAAKVSQSVFDALEQRVTTNEGTLAVHADMIAARVTSEVFDLLEERVETAEGQLTVLADEVSAKVSQTVFDTLVGRVETAEGILEVLPGQINAKADQSVVDTLTERVEGAEGQLSVLAAEITARVTQEVFDTLEGRVEMAEGKLSVLADEISTKVSQTVFDELEGLVSSQGAQISLNTESITGIVTRVDDVEGQVTEHASQIQLLGDEITLKVQVRQDGKLVIAGIGMAVDEDGQSEVAMLADRFRVLTSVNGEMKSVFAVDTETGKVYVLGDLIATGLIRATEVQAEVAKHLLLAAEVATVDHLGALKIEAGAITVGGEAPGISLTKPEGAKLWHFDGSLVSTDGISPESGAVATLRPDGRFGGAVAVEVGTTNLVNDPVNWKASSNRYQTTTVTDETFLGCVVSETVKLTSNTPPSTLGTVTLQPGETATASIWVKQIDIKVGNAAYLIFYLSPNTLAYSYAERVIDRWQRLTVTYTNNTEQAITPSVYYYPAMAEGAITRQAAPQIEKKPFATSVVDGTRAAGRLWYPQLLDKKRGTLSVWINPHVVVSWNNFFLMNLSTGRFLLFFYADGSSRWDFGPNNSGPRTPAGTIVAGQWAMHTLTWDADAGVYRYYVNGEFVGEHQYVEPDSLPPVLPTVNNYGALIDELLILPYAATPEQIQAWYAMGAPFVDPNSAINADASPISAARGQVYIGEPGIAVANGAMIFVSGTFSHDQLGRLITAAVDRPLTTDPGGQKSVSAPVEISAARGVEIYKGKLNVWAGTGGAGDKRYIHDGRVTDDGIVGMDAQKLTGTVAMENLPEHLIRTAPGVSGAVMYWGSVRVAESATVNITYTTAMPYTPLVYAWERHGQFLSSAWVGLNLENISTTGFRLRNSSSTDSGTIYWMSVCASHDPSTSTCNQCQETCQKNCQNYCQDSCETGVCQLTCQSDCKTTCESACQDACMFSCQLPPPLTLWE